MDVAFLRLTPLYALSCLDVSELSQFSLVSLLQHNRFPLTFFIELPILEVTIKGVE